MTALGGLGSASRRTKTVAESASEMVQVVLPNDTNPLGNVLGGRVMHWIDLVGAIVAYRHCHGPIVTASLDRLDFRHPIKLGEIALLKARLVYVGRTSMEVLVDVFVDDPPKGTRNQTSAARVTYVAIDKRGRPVPVPGLKLVTDDERRLFEEALARRRSEGRA
ncbi:MAG: acyl-CoA thioesterase [Nitrospirota bacterium]